MGSKHRRNVLLPNKPRSLLTVVLLAVNQTSSRRETTTSTRPLYSVPHSSRLDSHIWFTAELKVTFPPLFTVRFTHLTLNICGSLSSRESYLCFSCLRPAVCCFSYYDSLDKSERVAGLVWRSWGQSPDLNSIKHLCQSRYHRTSVFDLNRINAFQLLSWPLEADSHVKMV